MTERTQRILDELFTCMPALLSCREPVDHAVRLLIGCARSGGTVLACGNGGSASDAEHLVGELMNRFLLHRPVPADFAKRLSEDNGSDGSVLAGKLQRAIAAISLVSQTSLTTAIANDTGAEMVFAQQVYGYGKPGDVLVAFSTSGNASNVVNAARVAKACAMSVIGLTGHSGGTLASLCDSAIRVPETVTHRIQELHLPVYHALCATVEQEMFG